MNAKLRTGKIRTYTVEAAAVIRGADLEVYYLKRSIDVQDYMLKNT